MNKLLKLLTGFRKPFSKRSVVEMKALECKQRITRAIPKLIMIEGCDSVGKATQSRLLKKHLESKGKTVTIYSYPDYGSAIGSVIKDYLNGEYGDAMEVNAKLISCVYMLDRAKSLTELNALLEDPEHVVILDRSPYSNAAFQSFKGDTPNNRKKLREWLLETEFGELNYPRPDLVLFLDLPPSIGRTLMNNRGCESSIAINGKKDQHEADLNLLESAHKTYVDMAKEEGFYSLGMAKGGKIRDIDSVSKEIEECVRICGFYDE